MKKSQVIDILTTLDKSEIREFRKWLLSPVHNQREDVVQLFDYLMAGNHLYEDKFLEKERVFRKIFGKEPYNDAKLRQTVHFLMRNVEEYLAYKAWRKDEIKSKIPLVSQFRKRKLNKLFSRTIHTLEKAQESLPYRTDNYYRNEYLLQLEIYTFTQERRRTPDINLQKVADTLDRTYLLEKLKLGCRMVFHQSVYKTDFDFNLLHKIVAYIEEEQLIQESTIAVYYYIFKAITEQEKDQIFFEKLRNEIQLHGELFLHHEKREVYLMAINYCIGKMNAGIEEFVREAFEWYRQGFKDGILIENKTVSRWSYLNAVINALRLNEYEWAENFIEHYAQYIESKHRENFSHFCKAKLLYEQKKYDEAMEYLIHVEYDDILINLNAKSMLLKIFYSQNEIDVLESLLDSMTNYMRRKKVIGYHRSIYSNLIRFTKKLIKISPYQKEKVSILKKEIESAEPLPEKKWLLAQIEKI